MNIPQTLGICVLIERYNVNAVVIALFKYALCGVKVALFKLLRALDIARQQARYLAHRCKIHLLGAAVIFKK